MKKNGYFWEKKFITTWKGTQDLLFLPFFLLIFMSTPAEFNLFFLKKLS